MTSPGGGSVTLFAGFECKILPQGELFLVIEHPELYQLRLNGNAVAWNESGFWHQPAWRKCLLPKNCLQKGANVLELTTHLDAHHPGLESVFLLGDFSVWEAGEGAWARPPTRD